MFEVFAAYPSVMNLPVVATVWTVIETVTSVVAEMTAVVTAALVLPANLAHPDGFVAELEPWIVAVHVQGAD